MSVISIKEVSKIYNPDKIPVKAVDKVDLEIEKGEFTAIVGPSGSGKSTFLNIVGGLDNPSSGAVVIDGVDISTFKESALIDFRLNNIGFVFQSYNLIPVLSSLENVEFIMLMQKIPKEQRHARAIELLKEVGLEKHLDRKPSELSGGQQQRVAVARALASRPKFILADEPTANLDSHSTENLMGMMADINKKEEATFLFATHDQRVIDKARRVVTLEDGRIVKDEKR